MRQALRKLHSPGEATVLLLVVCLFAFAIYLKVWPPISSTSVAASASQVKFWVKNSGQNTTVKLATVSSFAISPPAAFNLVEQTDALKKPGPASTLSLKDAFAEATHWFRPPPRS
jgi:hypothetical protein